jgi:hypothetical protein
VCSFGVEEISPQSIHGSRDHNRMNKQEDPRMNLANAVVAGIVVRASSHKLGCCCCDDRGGSFFFFWKKILDLLSNNVEGVLHSGEGSLEEQRNMSIDIDTTVQEEDGSIGERSFAVEMVFI